MTFRLTPVLCVLMLAGCASSEPQNVSYAPPPVQSMSVPAASSEPLPALAPPPAPFAQDPASPLDGDAAPQAALPPGATNCSTVDEVTLCDAPSDPQVDETPYTN